MKIEVYHRIIPTFEEEAGTWDQYRKVAVVTVRSRKILDGLEDAFRLTNHIDEPWVVNVGVIAVPGVPYRSTSVGDLAVVNGKSKWLCLNLGWKRIR